MKSFDKLLAVMTKLRSPKGCPWDRKQSHKSLLKYLDEEAKEFKQAVYKKDYANMEEELGDVLLQVIFHAQLAKEKGRFTMKNVIDHLTQKLTLRHPHVFGYTQEHKRLLGMKSLKTEKDVLANWKALKTLKIRRRKSLLNKKPRRGEGVPF